MEVDQVVCKDLVQRGDVTLHVRRKALLLEAPDITSAVRECAPCTNHQRQENEQPQSKLNVHCLLLSVTKTRFLIPPTTMHGRRVIPSFRSRCSRSRPML